MASVLNWLQNHEVLIWFLLTASAATFILSIFIIPAIIINLPADYFVEGRYSHRFAEHLNPLIRYPLMLVKNIIGIALIVLGCTMLLTPGPGVATIVAGLIFVNFPRKYQALRWLVGRKPVLKTINWTRMKSGKAKLIL
ncbi:MAG: PGPGW domain-containing protein [Spongiibacteraceae bacterium]